MKRIEELKEQLGQYNKGLHYLKRRDITDCVDDLCTEIDGLRALLAQQPAQADGKGRDWQTGTPSVKEGGCETFWCCIENDDGKRFHRYLDYANRHVMPLADGIEDAPEGTEPVPNSDEDFYWTGWHEKSCDQCETQWTFKQRVIAWMRLPSYAAHPPRPARTEEEQKKFRGAFPVLAGHCKPTEVVVLESQFNEVADSRDAAVARLDSALEAIEAARVFVTPQEKLKGWNEYKEDALRRMNAALAAKPKEGV